MTAAEIAKRKQKRVEKQAANAAWSNKVVKKTEKEVRKEKKGKKRKWLQAQNAADAEGEVEQGNEEEEEDDWAEEERMAKKAKKGEVNQHEQFVDL